MNQRTITRKTSINPKAKVRIGVAILKKWQLEGFLKHSQQLQKAQVHPKKVCDIGKGFPINS